MDKGGSIQSVQSKEDIEMKEAAKGTEGLSESKHATKQLSEEEIERMAKEIGLEEEEVEDEDKEMGEEEVEEGRSDLLNALQDSRNALGLIKSILKNNEMVEEFKALPNKKKWWKLAKDANLAKRLIIAAGDVIEGRYWKGGDLEGKEGWKVVTKILLEAGDLESVKEASKAERIWRTTGASKGRGREEEGGGRKKDQRNEEAGRGKKEERGGGLKGGGKTGGSSTSYEGVTKESSGSVRGRGHFLDEGRQGKLVCGGTNQIGEEVK